MIARSFQIALMLSVCAPAVAQPVATEVIAIKRGTFVYENHIGMLDIAGTHGFKLNVRIPGLEGHFDAIAFCDFSEECTPGAVIEIGAGWAGSALQGGIATRRGVTYDDIGGPLSPSGGQVSFSGSITMPEMNDGPASVTVPFDFGGLFVYGDDLSSQIAILTGGGFVTLLLEPGIGGSWLIRRAQFTFRPVRR